MPERLRSEIGILRDGRSSPFLLPNSNTAYATDLPLSLAQSCTHNGYSNSLASAVPFFLSCHQDISKLAWTRLHCRVTSSDLAQEADAIVLSRFAFYLSSHGFTYNRCWYPQNSQFASSRSLNPREGPSARYLARAKTNPPTFNANSCPQSSQRTDAPTAAANSCSTANSCLHVSRVVRPSFVL